MTNYLIMPKNTTEHYFYKSGIYMKRRLPSGIWQEPVPVLPGGKDGFGLYCSTDKNVHIICSDYGGNLIYAVSEGNEWKKYVISRLASDISVSDMRLYSIRGRLNLMYSALYGGENLLIHCILGDHAKPSAVDTLEAPHFFIKGSKVYYTNTSGVFGFVSLADEKPSGFTPVYENAHFGTVYDVDGRERILFSRDSSVFLDGEEIAHDTHIEAPILSKVRDKFYVMWKNGGFVRYVTSPDCEVFSKPMRFMTTGKSMDIFTVQKGNDFSYYYGYSTQKEPALLGSPDIFEVSANYHVPTSSELEKVKDMLNKTQKDVSDAKKEIARLGKILGSLSD